MTGAATPSVLIFRKRLLPWSETFIAAQGTALRRYRPVFTGYSREAEGGAYLDGQDVVALSDHELIPRVGLGKLFLKTTGRVPGRWRRALERRRPALVHAHFGTNAPPALTIGATLGIPVIVTYHGMDIAIAPRSTAKRRERERVFARADRILAVSEFIADKLRDAGCPAAKVTVHHIGVDTDRFTPASGEPRHPHRVLFVGRLVPKKGLVHLIRAMERVRQRVPQAELVVAGDGPLRARLEGEARSRGVAVEFLGVQTPAQVLELMRGAALLGSPSVVAGSGNAEGLPITILEAQATGLPVVGFPSGGSPDGVRHGRTGFLAPAADEAALAAHIVELLADPGRRRQFSAEARRFMEAHFDLRRQTALLEDIYDDVVRSHASRPSRQRS